MIKYFTTISKHISNNHFLSTLGKYTFTRRAKNSQLILHSKEQIQNMIIRKNSKASQKEIDHKPWKTNIKDETMKFRVSLVGLPNCGKSSLFNCLVGERVAIVDKHHGTTRDRKQFNILNGLASIIDTPGVQTNLLKHSSNSNTLKEQIFKQTITAIHQSHLIFFVVDIKKPVTSEQIEFAKYLKTFGKNSQIVLVCNKCDNLFDEGEVINQSSKLGFKTMFTVSSEEGTGVLELLNYINDRIPEQVKQNFQKKRREREEKFEKLIIKLKQQIVKFNSKTIKIKQWENDFRKINPNPEDNEDLDEDNYEDYIVKPEEGFSNTRGAEIKNIRMKNAIKICIIGRPNVGKSTIINQILGQDKMVVSQIPHTTRDSIRSKIEYKSRKIQLIDTAGLNTPNIEENDEQYLKKVQISTMLHVQQSHVVVYVMDAFSSFVIDDFTLIQKVIKQGRPVIIAVNKWQAIKDPFRYKAKNYLAKQLEKNLGEIHGNPLVFISAKMNMGLQQMLDKIINTYDKWNMRISTGLLNDWLQNFKKLDNIPKYDNFSLKINYLIQARVRPPHFIFFVNSKDLFMPHYQRFLLRNLATEFKMDGIPLRLTLRSTNNRQNKHTKPKQRKQSKMKTRMQELKQKYGNFGL